jgi:hypothetical protein
MESITTPVVESHIKYGGEKGGRRRWDSSGALWEVDGKFSGTLSKGRTLVYN